MRQNAVSIAAAWVGTTARVPKRVGGLLEGTYEVDVQGLVTWLPSIRQFMTSALDVLRVVSIDENGTATELEPGALPSFERHLVIREMEFIARNQGVGLCAAPGCTRCADGDDWLCSRHRPVSMCAERSGTHLCGRSIGHQGEHAFLLDATGVES